MTRFDPSQLAAWTGGRWTAPPVSPLLGFGIDSRQLGAGQVFVALRTEQRDGHEFLAAAENACAAAALVSSPNPTLQLPQLVVADPLAAFQAIARAHRAVFPGRVVGISGSAGKTSTKNLLALLLGGEGAVLATEGNLNNHLGVPLTLTRLDPERHRFAVVEAGISGPGEMAPLAEMISPEVSIITLVAPAHVAGLGSVEGVAREKAVLSAHTRDGGVAIFPQQCAAFAAFAGLGGSRLVLTRVDALPSGPAKEGCVPYAISHRDHETVLTLAWRGEPRAVTLRRVSDGMAQNAALAISAALWLGVDTALIQPRLAGWVAAGLRGEWRREAGRLLYVDCYNANPAAMADALDAFYAQAPAEAPRLLVLGGMEELGAEAAMFHRALGRALQVRPQDRVFAIGEHAAALRAGALDGGVAAAQIAVVDTLEPVRSALADFAGSVFLKGSRRHRLEALLETVKEEPAHV
ncbi:MAG: UDP-N-acetylmuramoyl-tripeptide--D-alanyl-D-alanine ligase [Opitutaceae bacterium]|nr:UDP-N-acetylmuramoyl-tripeptide--D-alanyl-D-alanine ligase [Opitutaceae bacterium]